MTDTSITYTHSLLRPIASTTIHPVTHQAIATGVLPAGTGILDAAAALRDANEWELNEITVRVRDSSGFVGLERVCPRDLRAALIDRLPVANSPPTREPVTVGGIDAK